MSLGSHVCSQENGLCSDLCLLKSGGYQCACPTGIALKPDGKNCDYGEDAQVFPRVWKAKLFCYFGHVGITTGFSRLF